MKNNYIDRISNLVNSFKPMAGLNPEQKIFMNHVSEVNKIESDCYSRVSFLNFDFELVSDPVMQKLRKFFDTWQKIYFV